MTQSPFPVLHLDGVHPAGWKGTGRQTQRSPPFGSSPLKLFSVSGWTCLARWDPASGKGRRHPRVSALCQACLWTTVPVPAPTTIFADLLFSFFSPPFLCPGAVVCVCSPRHRVTCVRSTEGKDTRGFSGENGFQVYRHKHLQPYGLPNRPSPPLGPQLYKDFRTGGRLGHISWARGENQPTQSLSCFPAAVSATVGRRRKTCKLEKQETVVEDQLSKSGLWA